MYKYLLNFFKYGDGNIKVNKPILAILILLILLIFMSTASAMEDNANNETQVLSAVNNNEIVAIDNTQEILSAGEPATFADLAVEVGDGGDKNLGGKIYTYDGSSAAGNSFITITQPGTIDGQGAVIDMDGAYFRLFKVNTDNVIFKNITFKNANFMEEGAVILFYQGGTVEDCTFVDNTAGSGAAGAVYFTGDGTVTNCNFTRNTASGNNAGAVYFNGIGTVTDSNFINNTAGGRLPVNGGAVYFAGAGSVTGSNFIGNNVTNGDGGAVYFYGDGTVTDCNFTNNSVSGYAGAVYFKYTGKLENSNFINNSAEMGNGAVYFSDPGSVNYCNFINNTAKNGGAGAVYFKRAGNVTNSNFTNNSAANTVVTNITGGGAIQFNTTANVDNCIFINNSAIDSVGGGAVYIGYSGNISNSNFNHNYAEGTKTHGGGGSNNGGGAVRFVGFGTVENCNFTNNYMHNASGGGAVYFIDGGNVIKSYFYNNTVINSSHGGGAIHFSGSSTVSYSNFTENHIMDSGGAIYFFDSGSVDNCNFINNEAWASGLGQGGGAIYFSSYNNVTNSNFTDNIAVSGGAIYFWSNFNVTKSYFTRNNATSIAGAILIYNAGKGDINDCNFTDNYGHTTGAVNAGQGSNMNIVNSNFKNNHASSQTSAGSINMASFSYGKLINCTFSGSFAGAAGVASLERADVIDCNFINNSAVYSAGALRFMKSGNVENCFFNNNSANTEAGAIQFSTSGTVNNSNFTNNKADNGGAIYFTDSGTVNNSNFTNNNASIGSAIYFSDNSYTRSIKNSILLNNRANSKSLTITRNNYTIEIIFKGNDNLLNAIYSSADVTFDNVDYWSVNGVTNTGANTISPSDLESGQNITVTVNKAGNIEENIMITGVNGNISFDITNGGDYIITAHHLEDSYYTDISATKMINDSAIDLTVFGATVIANVTPGAIGNVTFTVKNESGIVKTETINLDESIAELNLLDLDLGKYNITAVYNGYSSDTLEYLPSNNNISLDLSRYEPIIIIETENIHVGRTEVINITVNGKKDNNLIVYVNGEEYHVTDGELILDDLTEDIYYVTAFWEGDDKYMPGSNSSKFLVYNNYYITAHNKTILVNTVNITADSNINHEFFKDKMYFDIYFYPYNKLINLSFVGTLIIVPALKSNKGSCIISLFITENTHNN